MSRLRRAVLILPGGNRHMAEKAAGLPADQVILDLEDAVPPVASEKVAARAQVLRVLQEVDFGERLVSVRANPVGSELGRADLRALAGAGASLGSVVLPKVESAEEVSLAASLLPGPGGATAPGLEAQIESPAGLEAVAEIAAATPRLEALIFGPGDFAAAMGMPQLVIGAGAVDYPGDLWHYARFRIAVAARARGLQVIDGPCSDIADLAGLERSARSAAALGLDGMWAIHPSQLATIRRAFTPGPEQVERARQVLAALEARGGAARLEGEMIDEAHRRMAQAVLARAGEESQ
ncbi:MAG: HpcH/HpaI aldolase/citrate lyase family protein [Candidatus Dormibacteria bacterium]